MDFGDAVDGKNSPLGGRVNLYAPWRVTDSPPATGASPRLGRDTKVGPLRRDFGQQLVVLRAGLKAPTSPILFACGYALSRSETANSPSN